ncbi:MAG: type II secretion system protein GspL [Sphingomonadaceae bacterium]
MTTLFIRYPAKASVDSGAVQTCPFALAGDGGQLLQQGAAALGNLADLVASARRVVLLLAASDVTLLRMAVPPLSAARLKAALPGLVEEQILGDPADCVLAAGPTGADGQRSIAVVQRAWLEVLVKALVAQGAHSVTAVPAQLCLPVQPGAVAATLDAHDLGLELTLRRNQYEGFGLTLGADPEAALSTLRALAGDEPVSLYLSAAHSKTVAPLLARLTDAGQISGMALADDHWAHWIAGARAAGIDLAAGLGAAGNAARQWQRWRWPLRFAVAALLVNVAGMNIEWLRLKKEADGLRQTMLQTFKAAYPNEAALYPAEQMRRNLAQAKVDSGQMAQDEFISLSAAFAEALPRKDVIASLEYRDRALLVKLKPNTVDGAALGQIKAALAARRLDLTETAPGAWQIKLASTGAKS